MMARFRAEQAVLQSEQSLVLVPHEEVCKSREILGMFCTAWLLQGPKLQGKHSRGALHNCWVGLLLTLWPTAKAS